MGIFTSSSGVLMSSQGLEPGMRIRYYLSRPNAVWRHLPLFLAQRLKEWKSPRVKASIPRMLQAVWSVLMTANIRKFPLSITGYTGLKEFFSWNINISLWGSYSVVKVLLPTTRCSGLFSAKLLICHSMLMDREWWVIHTFSHMIAYDYELIITTIKTRTAYSSEFEFKPQAM